MATKAQVKTYRVINGEGLKVGDSIRHFGELIPEASTWPNTKAYIDAHQIEIAFIDKSELDEFNAGLKKKSSKPKVEDSENQESKTKTPRKRVAKKTTKKTVKKGVKKSGLAEQSV